MKIDNKRTISKNTETESEQPFGNSFTKCWKKGLWHNVSEETHSALRIQSLNYSMYNMKSALCQNGCCDWRATRTPCGTSFLQDCQQLKTAPQQTNLNLPKIYQLQTCPKMGFKKSVVSWDIILEAVKLV